MQGRFSIIWEARAQAAPTPKVYAYDSQLCLTITIPVYMYYYLCNIPLGTKITHHNKG